MRSGPEMNAGGRDVDDFQEPIPRGFTLLPSAGGTFVIHHERTGMGCLTVFSVVFLAFWTLGCVALVYQYLHGGTMEGGDPISLWFVLPFLGFEVVWACFLAYLLFAKKRFRVDRDSFVMETTVLALQWHNTILRNSVRRIVQVKDGGEDEDSFPSWGLKVEADKTRTLIYRQPYEKSRWLGRILAQWAGVEFVEAPRE